MQKYKIFLWIIIASFYIALSTFAYKIHQFNVQHNQIYNN